MISVERGFDPRCFALVAFGGRRTDAGRRAGTRACHRDGIDSAEPGAPVRARPARGGRAYRFCEDANHDPRCIARSRVRRNSRRPRSASDRMVRCRPHPARGSPPRVHGGSALLRPESPASSRGRVRPGDRAASVRCSMRSTPIIDASTDSKPTRRSRRSPFGLRRARRRNRIDVSRSAADASPAARWGGSIGAIRRLDQRCRVPPWSLAPPFAWERSRTAR